MPTICQRCNTVSPSRSRQCLHCGVALSKTGIEGMQRHRDATNLLWAGFALAITAVLFWFARLMVPYTYALAVGQLSLITLIVACVCLVTGSVLKALGR